MNSPKQTYKNVMEILVDEEIEVQLKKNKTINPHNREYINILEVATFALNRLPSLYASSQEGIKKQKTRALIKYKQDIRQAVTQGFAAIERDPLRRSTPLPPDKQDVIGDAKKTLSNLDESLPKEELSNIVDFMESFLCRVQDEKIQPPEIIKLHYLLNFYWEENGTGMLGEDKNVVWID